MGFLDENRVFVSADKSSSAQMWEKCKKLKISVTPWILIDHQANRWVSISYQFFAFGGTFSCKMHSVLLRWLFNMEAVLCDSLRVLRKNFLGRNFEICEFLTLSVLQRRTLYLIIHLILRISEKLKNFFGVLLATWTSCCALETFRKKPEFFCEFAKTKFCWLTFNAWLLRN